MLVKFRDYLTKFDYPNIDQFDELQVADIFHKDNRMFLLSWIVGQINSTYSELLKESQYKESFLADFVYQNGFCTFSQKDVFVKGDPNLDITDQVIILNRMLLFLDDIQKQESISVSTNSEAENSSAVPLNELSSFLTMDVNIFPTIGPLKFRNTEDRNLLIEKYLKEYEELKNEILLLQGHEEDNDLVNNKPEANTKETSIDIERIEKVIAEMNTNAVVLLQQHKIHDTSNGTLNLEEDMLKELDANMCSLSKKLKNLYTISNFSTNNSKLSELFNGLENKDLLNAFKELQSIL